ncbi:hypothetical protein MtrunA17_Chr6g0482211 [Medicago truncatula]|nr:uncharacterized protein LOC11419321 [Medicago truncatula]XP_024642032.1 uncharacterized protein LOC11419321 [Medicago truncatula]XP_024642033.1 uncharacterized protein LOC11419321 [Medicago truncatula]RHN52591.1 hypothetical protein MtrunA17_Chr6g0482211 [Medicago truncatula]
MALENHERDNKKTRKWRGALTEVSNLSGWQFKHGYGNEHKIISNIVKQVSTRIQRVPIHNEISDVDRKVSQASQSVPGVSQTAHKATKVKMPIPHWDFKAEKTWRVVGLMSSVVGLLCYALSPSFNRLIGRWKPFKFFLYGVSSLVIFTTVLFAKQSSLPKQHAQFIKTCTIFAVLVII